MAQAFILHRIEQRFAVIEALQQGIQTTIVGSDIFGARSGRFALHTQRDGIDYNLAFIGPDFDQVLPSAFDNAYIRALFDYGYQRALKGYDWAKRPPVF